MCFAWFFQHFLSCKNIPSLKDGSKEQDRSRLMIMFLVSGLLTAIARALMRVAEKKHMKNHITCYTPGQPLPGICFFILSKGLNAGRPLDNPCPNCFVFACDTPEERERYFWITYGLWQAGHFKVYLVGSVIPFLRKPELVMLIEQADSIARFEGEKFFEQLRKLSEFHDLSKRFKNQLRQLELVKRLAVAKFIAV